MAARVSAAASQFDNRRFTAQSIGQAKARARLPPETRNTKLKSRDAKVVTSWPDFNLVKAGLLRILCEPAFEFGAEIGVHSGHAGTGLQLQ